MRIAVIDIGTNSTRLLVADVNNGSVCPVKTGLITTRLGEGIGSGPFLIEPAVVRTIGALWEFNEVIRNYGAERIIVAATSAVRDAENRQDFLDRVKRGLGWEVRVLSGEQEAECSYRGAVMGLPGGLGEPVVVDIGGGSTELIWTSEKSLKCVSARIGAVRMTECSAALPEIKEALSSYLKVITETGNRHLVGVGGTLTTLAAIDQKLHIYDSDKVHGYFLTREKIEAILNNLEKMTLEERKKLPGLQPQRADIITAGVRIALAVLEGLGLEGVTVSETDIMYGLLYNEKEPINLL